MLRALIQKFHYYADARLGLRSYSTANKICLAMSEKIKNCLLDSSVMAQKLHIIDPLELRIPSLRHFNSLLGRTLTTAFKDNYHLYQTLKTSEKNNFRDLVLQRLLIALDDSPKINQSKCPIVLGHQGWHLKFELPKSFFEPIFLKNLVSNTVRNELVAISQRRLHVLAKDKNNQFSRLPPDIRNHLANFSVFYQPNSIRNKSANKSQINSPTGRKTPNHQL